MESKREDQQSYNGWSNYPTWAVNMYLDGNYTSQGTYHAAIETVGMALDYADGHPNVPSIWTQDQANRFSVADHLQRFVDEEMGNESGLVGLDNDLRGWAMAHVDWNEIAEHWFEHYSELSS